MNGVWGKSHMSALDFPLAGSGTGNTGEWVRLLRVGAVSVNGDAHGGRCNAETGECQLTNGEHKRTVDERIDAIALNVELMSEMQKHSMERMDRIEALLERHERDWQRFKRVMRAGLQAWLDEQAGES